MANYNILSVLLHCIVIFVEFVYIETVNPDLELTLVNQTDTTQKMTTIHSLYTNIGSVSEETATNKPYVNFIQTVTTVDNVHSKIEEVSEENATNRLDASYTDEVPIIITDELHSPISQSGNENTSPITELEAFETITELSDTSPNANISSDFTDINTTDNSEMTLNADSLEDNYSTTNDIILASEITTVNTDTTSNTDTSSLEDNSLNETMLESEESYPNSDNSTGERHNCSKISTSSVLITNYQNLDNGSLLDLDSKIMYPPGYFLIDEDGNSSEIYGCICLLKTCVRKCCAKDQAMDANGECIDEQELLQLFKLQFINEETLDLEHSVDHHVLYGKPCPQDSYRLENPAKYFDDRHYLLSTGVLNVPLLSNFTVEEFCMELFEDENLILPLICTEQESQPPVESDVQLLLYPIGMILSIPFLMATFLVYLALPQLRNLHGMCLMAYVGGLFVAYVFLSIVQLGGMVISMEFCIGCAFAIYFSFHASFFWLNVMCFDIWWTFSGLRPLRGSVKEREYKKFVMYSCYAWGAPLIMLIVSLFMDLLPDIPDDFIKPEFGVNKCWFRNDSALLAYFFGPIGVIVLCNIVLFIATAFRILHLKKETKMLKGGESKRHDEEANRQRFNLYLKLFIVMGVNWIMEVISWAAGGPSYLWYITDLGNTLQGVLIFIIFVWKQKIRRLLARRFFPKLGGSGNDGSVRSHPTPSRTSSYNNYTCRTSISTNDQLVLKSLPNGSYRVSDVP